MTSSQPANTSSTCVFSCKIKQETPDTPPVKNPYKTTSYGGIIRIRLRVEGASFLSACHHKLPCIYVCVLYIAASNISRGCGKFLKKYASCRKPSFKGCLRRFVHVLDTFGLDERRFGWYDKKNKPNSINAFEQKE